MNPNEMHQMPNPNPTATIIPPGAIMRTTIFEASDSVSPEMTRYEIPLMGNE
jgi:hypothetical protein